MAHFNPKLPIVLEADDSGRGIGGVMAHISAYGRRENTYPTIQKEALAIVESTKKFFDYLIGHKFLLRTDHKPLVIVFGDKKGIPTIAAARMQRCAHFLMSFDYPIEPKKSIENAVADAMSLPLEIGAAPRSEGEKLHRLHCREGNSTKP